MRLTLALAVLTALLLSATTGQARPLKAHVDPMTVAEDVTVQVRANVQVHYYSADELQRRRTEADPKNRSVFDDVVAGIKLDNGDEYYPDVLLCSGFAVQKRGHYMNIMTAQHCTQDEELYMWGVAVGKVSMVPSRVVFFNGDTAPVKHVYRAQGSDSAILIVQPMHHHPVVELRSKLPRRGEKLFVFGMPGGRPWMYSSAVGMDGVETEAANDGPLFAGLIPLECPSCYGGDSGAGVFDSRGRVVGFIDAGLGQPALAAMVPEYKFHTLMVNQF